MTPICPDPQNIERSEHLKTLITVSLTILSAKCFIFRRIRNGNRETETLKALKAKKPIRDNIRDTLTPSRVGLLSWAFAAVVMGTVGLASYKFSTSSFTLPNNYLVTGLPLPPAGDVGSTASIGSSSRREIVEILGTSQSSGGLTALEKSQIAVLQEQIVRLRRRLSTMSEQNDGYSRRIAALESGLGAPESRTVSSSPASMEMPSASFLKTKEPLGFAGANAVKRPMAPLPKPQRFAQANREQMPVAGLPSGSELRPSDRRPASRRINIHTGQQPQAPAVHIPMQEPVRIVDLPLIGDTPVVTGSIPKQVNVEAREGFDSTPTRTTAQPKVIEPSDASGTLRGGGQSTLKRSDFGAVVGHYSTLAEAANAWAKFREQNEDRMRDLRPMIKNRMAQGGVSLLIGPFGNAADAAAACFYLLDVTDLCQPALYSGDPLIASANFPNQS